MDFKTRLIAERKAKGLTQEELAEKCNITARTIQRIESGQVQPRTHTIRQISESLDFEYFNATDRLSKHSIFWHIKDLFNLKTQKMKKISVLSLVATAFTLATLLIQAQSVAQNHPTSGITINYNGDSAVERVDVVFTNELTLDSLITMKERLSALNISIDYKFMEFDDSGHLTGIACKMGDNQAGGSGSGYFNAPVLKDEAVSGFYYDYSSDAKKGFCCGTCWPK